VTAQGAGGSNGSCTFTITGYTGNSATLTVGVTTTGGTISAKHPTPSMVPAPKPGPAPHR
jgi:hypothetical protein